LKSGVAGRGATPDMARAPTRLTTIPEHWGGSTTF
jgi:hypothetical protein